VRVLGASRDGRVVCPWSRQSGESRQAFAAFETYRNGAIRGGRRSIRRTADESGRSRQLLERWSRRWSWVERCEHYDFALDRLRQARTLAEIQEQARQAALATFQGSREELARVIDGDFLLCAALMLPLEDLAGLVGPEGAPPEGLGGPYTDTSLNGGVAPTRRWAGSWAEQQPATLRGGRR